MFILKTHSPAENIISIQNSMNILNELPPEMRETIDKVTAESDQRRLSVTSSFERNRRAAQRHTRCHKEIHELGENAPSTITAQLQAMPTIRNRNWTGLDALMKAILLRALHTSSIVFNIRHLPRNDALVCVLRNIQNVTIRVDVPNLPQHTQDPYMSIFDIAWIIRNINDNHPQCTLRIEDVPYGYSIYSSYYRAQLQLPVPCKIQIVGDVYNIPVLRLWMEGQNDMS